MFFGNRFNRRKFANACINKYYIKLRRYLLYLFRQRAYFGQVAGVRENGMHFSVQCLFGLIQRSLAAAGDNNGGALFKEFFGCCKTYSAVAAGNKGGLIL